MISLAPDAIEKVIQLMYQDKKNDKGRICCTLLNGIGSANYDMILNEEEIAMALLHLSLLAKISN